MRLRRPFPSFLAALALAASAGAAFVACAMGASSDLSPSTGRDAATVDGTTPTGPLCPRRDLPRNGAACDLPEGTACEVGRCRGRYAICTAGTWAFAANPPVSEECPQFAPREGEECPACWSRFNFCTYGCGDAGGTPVSATCFGEDASWHLEPTSCGNVDAGDGGAE